MQILSGSVANKLSMGNAGLYALLGYGVVFLGLVLLMVVIMAVGKGFAASANRKAAKAPVVAETVEEAPKATAPGTAGTLKLHDVDPKIAAMLMAITADKLGKPINELRFISIKEVK